jgi:hypothetical protein
MVDAHTERTHDKELPIESAYPTWASLSCYASYCHTLVHGPYLALELVVDVVAHECTHRIRCSVRLTRLLRFVMEVLPCEHIRHTCDTVAAHCVRPFVISHTPLVTCVCGGITQALR